MSRLSVLAQQAEDIAARARTLPVQQEAAKAKFIEVVRRGSPDEEVEAARLHCVALYEAQLDLIIESAANRRAIAMETGNEPQ